MRIEQDDLDRAENIASLFRRAFGQAEGAAEGELVGGLSADLMATTAAADLYTFTAHDGSLVAALHFSRLRYADDERSVFVLGPVAVAPERQGQGLGQRLIRHGLNRLAKDRVDIALTYGDPGYYSRFGFVPIGGADAAAPYPLQYPHGWQGLALSGGPDWAPLRGAASCVAAFRDPAFW